MLKHLFLLLLLSIGGFCYSQDSMTFEFNHIEEAVYDYNQESFKPVGNSEEPGKIKLYLSDKAVIIDSQNDKSDKKLRIIEKDNGSESTMYICAMDGQYFAFQISDDQKELTLVSADYRYIYRRN